MLMESTTDFSSELKLGVTFIPFVPTKGTICTLVEIDLGGGYIFEEVKAYIGTKECNFVPKFWRPVTDIPSAEEVNKFVEDCQLVSI